MSRNTTFLLLLVAIIAIFFRFWSLETIPPGLYPDEAVNGNNALEALQTRNWKVFYPENNGREGLFINIESASLALFGNKPWALRSVSAVFGTLTVLGIFFLARLLFWKHAARDKLALIASFFAAVSFWHVNFSRIGFRAIMAPFFLVWGFYFLFRFYKDIGSNASQTLSALTGGILFGLGFHSYIAYRVSPLLALIPIVSGLIIYKKDKMRTSCFPCLAVLFIFFAFVSFLPLGIYYLNNPEDFFGRTSQISIFSEASPLTALLKNTAQTIGMFWFKGDGNWRHNFAGEPELFWPVGIAFFLGIVLMLKKIFSREHGSEDRFNAFFLLSWLILMLLPVVISSEGIPHALRAIITIPAVFITAAWGLISAINFVESWLEKNKKRFPESGRQLSRIQKEITALVFLALALAALHNYNLYFQRFADKIEVYYAFNQNYVEIGEYLNSLPKGEPKYLVVNAAGVMVRGIPMPSQTAMFITNTFGTENQNEKNIFYFTPETLPYDSIKKKENFSIVMLEPDIKLKNEISKNLPGLSPLSVAGTISLVKGR